MAELQDRDLERRRADREFAAAIHGMKLTDSHAGGRTYGPRHDHMQRMKQRRERR